jgi:outer membrane protein TolC
MSRHARLPFVLFLLVLGLPGGMWAPAVAGAQEQPAPALTLDDCIRTALEHNPSLASSHESVVAAEANVRQTRSSYSPQLTLSANQGLRGSTGATGVGVTQSSDGASVSLEMTFWRSGRCQSVAVTEANLGAAEWSHLDTRLSVARRVADDYYGVLAATELVGVAEAGVGSAEEHWRQVLRQIEAGSVAESEVHTVNDDLAQAKLALIDARSDLRTSLATLKSDMGVPQDTQLRLAPTALGAEDSVLSEAEALKIALDNRPDVQAQKAVIRSREHAVEVARATYGPAVEVAGECLQSFPDWSAGEPSWGLTAAVTWPLLDGGQKTAAVAAALASLRSSRADLQALTDSVALEVEAALVELDRARESVKASEEAVTAARSRLTSAEVRYREGLGILLEVTDARSELTNAEAQNVEARYALEQARIGLQRAMGSLPLPGPAPEAQP